MKERDFQINFERLLITIIPGYNISIKLSSDTIFYYINKAKEEYLNLLYRLFQLNQEITDRLRTLVTTSKLDVKQGLNIDRFEVDYPKDYIFTLGEDVKLKITNNKCPNIEFKSAGVIEATIENYKNKLTNSLSEHRLHNNQAKPIRLYSDNKIYLYTDGNYTVSDYILTYLRKANDLGKKLLEEYKELPENTHQEIIDAAVRLYITEAASTQSKDKSKSEE